MALVASDEQREVLDRVSGLMSLLEGHGDITMDRAGAGLVPSADRFSRVLRQRRESTQGMARLLQQLIGLEAKMNQYAQGERFIEEVEKVGGTALLSQAWESPDRLPTLDEIRRPVGVDRAGRAGAGRLSEPRAPVAESRVAVTAEALAAATAPLLGRCRFPDPGLRGRLRGVGRG